MKKSILLLLTFVLSSSIFLYSQEKVDSLLITPSNVNGYLVKKFDGKTSNEIYNLLKKWIQYNIKNPDFSVTNDVKNEYISFNISGVGDIKYKESNNWHWGLYLKTEVRIKDDRVRLDFYVKDIRGKNGEDSLPIVSSGGISGMNALFDKKGKAKKATKTYRDDVNSALNDFADDLYSAIEGDVDYKKDDW